jgi:hypothetical protein
MTYKLIIENWHPTRLNQLIGCNPYTAGRRKKVDKNVICGYCLENRIPVAQGPREVSLLITLAPKQRAADPDAYWKSTLDGLVEARMLIDDNRHFVRHGPVGFERGKRRATCITLTDL